MEGILMPPEAHMALIGANNVLETDFNNNKEELL